MAFLMEAGRGPGDAGPIWQVFLGEVHSGVSGTQVVVKELKASASVQEQMQFLEEAQPYRWVAWCVCEISTVGEPGGRGKGRAVLGPGCAPSCLLTRMPGLFQGPAARQPASVSGPVC